VSIIAPDGRVYKDSDARVTLFGVGICLKGGLPACINFLGYGGLSLAGSFSLKKSLHIFGY